MDKREIQWNSIKITYQKQLNSFLVVPFVENAIKTMQRCGMDGKVVEVDIMEEVVSKKWCAVITTEDSGGMKIDHRFMDKVV